MKKEILKGHVLLNGEVVTRPETEVSESDRIEFSGAQYRFQSFVYYLLYKPAGFLTARSDREKRVVMELLPDSRTDIVPVGRLDLDTEGVLLLTNDGELGHKLLSPKNHVEKKYYAELDADLPENAGAVLSEPIDFSDFTSMPAKYQKISDRSAYLTVHEGKHHEVKRLFHHIGCDVTYLRREAFGNLTLENMKPGECRALTEDEITKLKSLV